jgi:hypothetical protein
MIGQKAGLYAFQCRCIIRQTRDTANVCGA